MKHHDTPSSKDKDISSWVDGQLVKINYKNIKINDKNFKNNYQIYIKISYNVWWSCVQKLNATKKVAGTKIEFFDPPIARTQGITLHKNM